MIKVKATSPVGSVDYLMSVYKSLEADQPGSRYYASVTEMLFEQVPGIKFRSKSLEYFEANVSVTKVSKDDEYVLHVKELNDYRSYIVTYHKANIKTAILHGAA